MKMLAFFVLVFTAAAGRAAPITVLNPYQFLDNRSANDANIQAGVVMQVGAVRVFPNSDGQSPGSALTSTPTTAVATSANATYNRTLNNINYSLNSYFYASGLHCPAGTCGADAYNPWTLTFSNNVDRQVAVTQGVSPTTTPLPFVNSVKLDPNATNGPRLSWSLPNVAHDAVAVRVRNNNSAVGPGGPCDPKIDSPCIADLVNVTYFPAGTSSVTIPPQLYQPGVNYSVEINVVDLRGNYIPAGGARNRLMFGDTQRMSRSYIGLVALQPGAPTVYLPTPVKQPDGSPSYQFNISNVGNQMIFVDPLIAIGYDYATGDNDPNFASVLLPSGIGDNLFDIIVNDVVYSVMGGETFDFTQIVTDGVDAFRVLGIEISAGLDPFDPTAFVTGLSFVGSGNFTGTMTPITTFVPVPGTILLIAIGVLVARRHRAQRPSA